MGFLRSWTPLVILISLALNTRPGMQRFVDRKCLCAILGPCFNSKQGMGKGQWKKTKERKFTVLEANFFQIKPNSLTNISHKFITLWVHIYWNILARPQQTSQKQSLTAWRLHGEEIVKEQRYTWPEIFNILINAVKKVNRELSQGMAYMCE